MPNFNKVIIVGNCTKDPEIRYTPKGTALVEMSIAVNNNYTTASGEKREETDFFEIVFWGKLAEIVSEYVEKGKPILVSGKLKQETWEDKETHKKRSKITIVAEEMQLLGSKEGSRTPSREPEGRSSGRQESRPAQRGERPQPPPSNKPPVDPDLDVESDDIPF